MDQLGPQPCPNPAADRMARFLRWQGMAMVLAISALIFGAIACLAEIAPRPGKKEELDHWEQQSEWLNTYLYASAFLLACGLVFINAFLLWPSYALLQAEAFKAHVGALVAFYGFTYTVMLASFYIPVATLLSSKVRPLKPPATEGSKLPLAFKGPFQVLKIVFALMSTAVASVFTGLLGLAV